MTDPMYCNWCGVRFDPLNGEDCPTGGPHVAVWTSGPKRCKHCDTDFAVMRECHARDGDYCESHDPRKRQPTFLDARKKQRATGMPHTERRCKSFEIHVFEDRHDNARVRVTVSGRAYGPYHAPADLIHSVLMLDHKLMHALNSREDADGSEEG